MQKLLNRKNWNSLMQVEEFIRNHEPKVKIISFNGYELVTNKGIIGMSHGEVTIRKNK
jgi:hypothetical protein